MAESMVQRARTQCLDLVAGEHQICRPRCNQRLQHQSLSTLPHVVLAVLAVLGAELAHGRLRSSTDHQQGALHAVPSVV
jgi:hypothetical protein